MEKSLQFSFWPFRSDLTVVLPPFHFVSQGLGIFWQQMLPVARDILHLQVFSDELASPRDTQGTVRTNFQFLQESLVLFYMYINFHSSVVFQMRNNTHCSIPSISISQLSFSLIALTLAVLLLSSRWYLLSGIINIRFHVSDTAWATVVPAASEASPCQPGYIIVIMQTQFPGVNSLHTETKALNFWWLSVGFLTWVTSEPKT